MGASENGEGQRRTGMGDMGMVGHRREVAKGTKGIPGGPTGALVAKNSPLRPCGDEGADR